MATHHKGQSITKTISLPKEMHDQVEERLASLKIKNLSRYVQDLIREDLKRRGALSVSEVADRPAKNGVDSAADELESMVVNQEAGVSSGGLLEPEASHTAHASESKPHATQGVQPSAKKHVPPAGPKGGAPFRKGSKRK